MRECSSVRNTQGCDAKQKSCNCKDGKRLDHISRKGQEMTDLHPQGTIAVASGDLARYPGFSVSLVNVLRPKNTCISWNIGLNVAANFNACIREMLNSDGEWIWIMGDDHIFQPDTLIRLLDHRLDVVLPLVVRRRPPFIPVLFKEVTPECPPGQFPPYQWHELPKEGGLFEVQHAGSAGMLIRRNVIEELGDDNWFEFGKLGGDQMNEDTYFCKKIREAGFKIFADLDTFMGHITPMCLWPQRTKDGQWTIGIDMGADFIAALPPSFLEGMARTVKEKTMAACA